MDAGAQVLDVVVPTNNRLSSETDQGNSQKAPFRTVNPCQSNGGNTSESDTSSSATSLGVTTDQPVVCRYFLSGCCRFGPSCRNLHPVEGDSNHSNLENNSNITKRKSSRIDPSKWIMAKEFVPSRSRQANETVSNSTNEPNISDEMPAANQPKSYAEVAGVNVPLVDVPSTSYQPMLCPYIYAVQELPKTTSASDDNPESEPSTETVSVVRCPYGDNCTYEHGEMCDMCGEYVLHPTDSEQRKKHQNECIRQHEQDMELSFAIARSRDKTCGICFETILEKPGREKQRFGILPNCNHIFCVQCIRKWRQSKQFEIKITRSCPECRVASDFICPSNFWVETKEEKNKLIEDYKNALREKNCKYYKQGEGSCPFGNNCFYKHALPDGTIVDVGKPKRNARRVLTDHGGLDVEDSSLWAYLELRTGRLVMNERDSDMIAAFYYRFIDNITRHGHMEMDSQMLNYMISNHIDDDDDDDLFSVDDYVDDDDDDEDEDDDDIEEDNDDVQEDYGEPDDFEDGEEEELEANNLQQNEDENENDDIIADRFIDEIGRFGSSSPEDNEDYAGI